MPRPGPVVESNEAGAEADSGQLPRNVWLLGWVALINDIASEMIYPLFPQFLASLAGSAASAAGYLGAIEGFAASVGSLLRLYAGAWSDRVRRRKLFVVVGYGLCALARPLNAFLTVPWQVAGTRTADRFGKGVRTPARDALIADSTRPAVRGRAFGLERAMDNLGAAVGPLLAAALLYVLPDIWPGKLQWVFLATIVPGLAVVALVVLGLKEVAPKETKAAPFELTLEPFGRDFRLYLLALVIFTMGNTSDMFLLLRAGELLKRSYDLKVAARLLLVLWSTFNVVTSLGSLVAGRMVDRFGSRGPILAGWLLYALVYLAFGLVTTAWQVWALFLSYALFYSLTEPAEKALVARLADGGGRTGLAYGWYNFAIGIATLPANILFGWLYEQWGPRVAFGWGAVMAFLAALILLAVRLEGKQSVLSSQQ